MLLPDATGGFRSNEKPADLGAGGLMVEGPPAQPAPAGPPTPLMRVKPAADCEIDHIASQRCCDTIIAPGLAAYFT
jgi:hypothetical protein